MAMKCKVGYGETIELYRHRNPRVTGALQKPQPVDVVLRIELDDGSEIGDLIEMEPDETGTWPLGKLVSIEDAERWKSEEESAPQQTVMIFER